MDSLERPPDLAIQLALEPLQSLVSHGLGSVERELKALRREANNVQAVRNELTQALTELSQAQSALAERVARLEAAMAPPLKPAPRDGRWATLTAAAGILIGCGAIGWAATRPAAAPGHEAVAVAPAPTEVTLSAPPLRPAVARAEATAPQRPVAAEPAPAPPEEPTLPAAEPAAVTVAEAPAPEAAPAAVETPAPAATSSDVAAPLAPAPTEPAPTEPTPTEISALVGRGPACQLGGSTLPDEPRLAVPPAQGPAADDGATQKRALWVDAHLVTGLAASDHCSARILELAPGEYRLQDYGDCSLDCGVEFGPGGDPVSLLRCATLGLRQVPLDCTDAKRGSSWFRICKSGFMNVDGEPLQIRVSRRLEKAGT